MANEYNLGTVNVATNPAAALSLVTSAGTNAGDKVVVAIGIPNSNPTAITVSYDGIPMTQDGILEVRGNFTLAMFVCDDPTGRASGKTISIAWTNTGTSGGGGAVAAAIGLIGRAAGAADAVGGVTGLSATPATGASGAPTSAVLDYVAVAAMFATTITAAGQSTPDNAWTAMNEAYQTTRQDSVVIAAIDIGAAASAQNESWTTTWGASKNWMAAIRMYEAGSVAPSLAYDQDKLRRVQQTVKRAAYFCLGRKPRRRPRLVPVEV